MTANKKKHVVFDFDGTLLDTDQVIVDSWQHVFKHYTGQEAEVATIYATFGETLRYTMHNFFPEEDIEEALYLYRHYQEEHADELIELYAGTRELVHAIQDMGLTTSIVTSRTGQTCRDYLDIVGLRDCFEIIISCDDTDAHKPDPRPLEMALERLGARKEDSIMIGDTKFDIGCCNNAGVDSVLVLWGKRGNNRPMDDFRPTHVIERPEQLLELL